MATEEPPDYRADFERLTLDDLTATPKCTNPDGHDFRWRLSGLATPRCTTCGVYYPTYSDADGDRLEDLKKARDPAPERLVYDWKTATPKCTNPDGHVFRAWPAGRAQRCETCGVYYSDVVMSAPVLRRQ